MQPKRTDAGLRLLLLIASFIIVCAGLKAASNIVVPVLAAMFVAIISNIPLQFLKRIGFPGWLAGSFVFTVWCYSCSSPEHSPRDTPRK